MSNDTTHNEAGMVRTNVTVTPEQFDTLKSISKTDGRPVSELIRMAIDLFVHTRAYSLRESKVEYVYKQSD